MPIFEYICKECGHRFEALVMGSKKAACPSCQGAKLEQQLSVFAAGSSKSPSSLHDSGRPAPSPCGSCGDPRGPGSCSMN
jgi:putative FmdB family regulatory protein